MVKDAVGSGVDGKLCNAFPAIRFPLLGTIGTQVLLNAIATVLCLAISLKLREVWGVAVAFVRAVHGLVANKRTIEESGPVSRALSQSFTQAQRDQWRSQGGAAGKWNVPVQQKR